MTEQEVPRHGGDAYHVGARLSDNPFCRIREYRRWKLWCGQWRVISHAHSMGIYRRDSEK